MTNNEETTNADSISADARAVHRRATIVDLHADTAQRLVDEQVDLQTRLPDGHLDGVRMREGGVTAQFFAVWVEPNHYGTGGQKAIERADKQVAAVRALAEAHPETWILATSAEDVRRAKRDGKLAALMGLEGGYAIDEKLENVEKYFRAGVRYIAPTWSVSLSWAGSSNDEEGQTRGLNEFGREVVREMNLLGVIVDTSHVSDKTFWDMIEVSTKPVIASHSNCRALCKHPRNLTDEQIKAIAKTNGVVCAVFYPAFIMEGWDAEKERVEAEISGQLAAVMNETSGTDTQKRIAAERFRANELARRLPSVSVSQLVDHIERMVALVGTDHVGVGSDFDGIPLAPVGLSNIAEFPNLTAELLRRGFSEADVQKILGENILRVMEETAKH